MTVDAVVVNRWKDFVERVAWTAIYFAAGAFLSWVESGDPWTWRTFLQGIGLAVAKVVIAQNMGDYRDGAAIPGGVIQTKATTRRT